MALNEATIQADWNSKVLPFYNRLSVGKFKNAQGKIVKFRYSIKSGAKKTIVVIPGRTESVMEFAEVLYDLDSPTTNLFCIDHQGQGESDRLLKNHQKGHVKDFKDYVNDMDRWMHSFVIPATANTDRYLFAHSMGGAIAAFYLKKNPTVFKKAAMTSPMFQVNTAPYSETVARDLSGFYVFIGHGSDYKLGGHDYDPVADTFEANRGTHSPNRFIVDRNILKNYPDLIVADPTMSWVHESLSKTHHIDSDVGPGVKTPLLILQAGKDETVLPSRQNSFCKKAKSCTIYTFPDSYHRIPIERDDIRELALLKIGTFFGI
jgi:lysophospholipase